MEPNPQMMQSEVEHREVLTEEVAVKSLGTMKKWHTGRHLAVGQCREPKELIEETVDPEGSWLPPAGRCSIMQQWYGTRETSSGRFRPREIVDHRRGWPQLAGG
jgi:hypothetical protein